MTERTNGASFASVTRRLGRIGTDLLASSAPYRVLRGRALHEPAVTILCYHSLGPDADEFDAWTVSRVSDFAAQIDFLRRNYTIVSLDDALAAAPRDWPRPPVVLTFDDGDVGLFTHLLPLIDRERVPVTIYVATSQIETQQPYWFDEIINALQVRAALSISLAAEGLGTWHIGANAGVERWSAISSILEALKRVSPDRRGPLTRRVVEQVPTGPQRPFSRLHPLSLDQLRTLARHPRVTIGSHSHCHNLLDQIGEDEVYASIARSRELLETWTGCRPTHFAYPNGNHNAAVRRIIGALGFQTATVLGSSLWSPGVDLLALPRIPVGRYESLARFKLRLVGI